MLSRGPRQSVEVDLDARRMPGVIKKHFVVSPKPNAQSQDYLNCRERLPQPFRSKDGSSKAAAAAEVLSSISRG